MIYLAIFILGFTGIRLMVALANLLGKQWLREGITLNNPLVSVLIPARNEAGNIGQLLHSLARHDYKNIEVIVYDDQSVDGTFEIVDTFAKKDHRFRAIKGKELPEGWLGKNHGCHNLALHANGDYLLYLDADVSIENGLIQSALANMENKKLDLFSIFPVQKMETIPEWLTVPLMNWILVSLLPLMMIRLSDRSSFSAANGQFMFFRADVYNREYFHKALKNNNVEDIAISRLMKKKGYKVQTLLGNQFIKCRMYQTWDDAVKGFSRNVFYFFGGSRLTALFFGLVTTFGFIPVAVSLPGKFLIIYLLMVALLRIIIAIASRQKVLYNLLLAPLQQLSFLFVVLKAWSSQIRKKTEWKGRIIDHVVN